MGVYLRGLLSAKGVGTEWDVRFFVLSNADELPTDHFSRIGIGNLHRSSYENPPRPFAESNPQLIALVTQDECSSNEKTSVKETTSQNLEYSLLFISQTHVLKYN